MVEFVVGRCRVRNDMNDLSGMLTATVCVRCVMDTSDPEITFDEAGVCSHCHQFDKVTTKGWFPGPEGGAMLNSILDEVRAAGRGSEYDCVLGLSGGVDSAILALRAKDWNLRVLAVHVDAGWNTELAVRNIQSIVEHCGFDLHTIVLDWEEVRELQLSYLRSGLSNQDVPQDHAFFAALYKDAASRKIRYVLSGGNIATESVFPKAWHASAMDRRNLKDVHRRFGSAKLKSFPTIGFLRYYVINPYIHRVKVLRPLNYLPYDRAAAIAELEERVGFRDYGRKHGESQFTRFFQNHYLPTRYGYDKRRPHLSSMILSGQITRDEALAELEVPLYDADALEADKAYFVKKLRLAPGEIDELLAAPLRTYRDFRNQDRYYALLKRVQGLAERVSRRKLGAYG